MCGNGGRGGDGDDIFSKGLKRNICRLFNVWRKKKIIKKQNPDKVNTGSSNNNNNNDYSDDGKVDNGNGIDDDDHNDNDSDNHGDDVDFDGDNTNDIWSFCFVFDSWFLSNRQIFSIDLSLMY